MCGMMVDGSVWGVQLHECGRRVRKLGACRCPTPHVHTACGACHPCVNCHHAHTLIALCGPVPDTLRVQCHPGHPNYLCVYGAGCARLLRQSSPVHVCGSSRREFTTMGARMLDDPRGSCIRNHGREWCNAWWYESNNIYRWMGCGVANVMVL